MNPQQHEMLVRVDAGVEQLVKSSADHETRIRNLEKSHHKQIGAMAVLSVLCSAAWNYLTGK